MNLKDRREMINDKLEEFFSEQTPEREEVEIIYERISEFVRGGGKRVRPALFLEGYKIGNGQDIEECLQASLSIELYHNYFLVHDDIMDRDKLRRGNPTVHAALEERFDRWTAVSHAINAGDYINLLSLQPILDSAFSKHRKYDAIDELIKTQKTVVEGQALDLLLHDMPIGQVTLEDVLNLHEMKTASYTITAPLRAGYKLSPRSAGDIDKLRKFGKKAGVAYQIKDDILGLFGENAGSDGPPSDIFEGKRTVPIVLAYMEGSNSQRETISTLMGTEVTEHEHERINKIVVETGAKSKSEEIANQLIEGAKKAINSIESGFLRDFAEFISARTH